MLALGRVAAVLRRGRIRRFGCRFRRGLTARERRNAVPDLPHGHTLYFFRGDGGVQHRQFPVGAVFAVGKPALVGFLHLLGAGLVAVGVPVRFGAGFHTRQHLGTAGVIIPDDPDLHHRILFHQRRDGLALQNGFHRLGVGEIFYIQCLGQGGAVVVPPLHRDDPVKPIDAQFQRGVDIDADMGGGGQVQPAAPQHHRRTGSRGQRQPYRPGG